MSDLIDRQEAIDALDEQIRQCDKALSAFDISMKDAYSVKVERASLVAFRETLEYMPSAQPERIKGRWIYHPEWANDGECGYECSVCHMGSDIDYNFCMRCGADMREVTE